MGSTLFESEPAFPLGGKRGNNMECKRIALAILLAGTGLAAQAMPCPGEGLREKKVTIENVSFQECSSGAIHGIDIHGVTIRLTEAGEQCPSAAVVEPARAIPVPRKGNGKFAKTLLANRTFQLSL